MTAQPASSAGQPGVSGQPGVAGSPARRIQRALRRTPLRHKLIASLLGLVLIALAIISTASALVYRDYLNSRADSQVRKLYQEFAAQLRHEPGVPNCPGSYGSLVAWFRPQGEKSPPAIICYGTAASKLPALPDVPTGLGWVQAHQGQLVTVAGLNNGDSWRVIAAPVGYTSNLGTARTGTLIAGVDLGDVSGSIGRLAAIDLVIGLIVLAGLAVLGVAVVRASLRPLADIEGTAQAIAAGDLARRVPDTDPRTEVGRLGQSLNAMLAQIEQAFGARTRSEEAARWSEERMRRFVADASHELRTPLTAIRGFAEHYRQRGGLRPKAAANGTGDGDAMMLPPPLTGTELDRIMRRVEDQAIRMGVLVDDLLLLARLDQQRPLDTSTVDLLALAADAAQDAGVVAPDRAVTVRVSSGAALLVLGDEVRLRQVVGNLVSNALTHTPAGTPVELRLRPGALSDGRPAAIIEVADQGPGLSPDQASRAFERFYRADPARTSEGTGLGLSIVAALVAAHGGQVWLESPPGGGAVFAIALPLAPEAVGAGPDPDDAGPDADAGPAAGQARPGPEQAGDEAEPEPERAELPAAEHEGHRPG